MCSVAPTRRRTAQKKAQAYITISSICAYRSTYVGNHAGSLKLLFQPTLVSADAPSPAVLCSTAAHMCNACSAASQLVDVSLTHENQPHHTLICSSLCSVVLTTSGPFIAKCARGPGQKQAYTCWNQRWQSHHAQEPSMVEHVVQYDCTFSRHLPAKSWKYKANMASVMTTRTCNRQCDVFPYMQDNIDTECTVQASCHKVAPK